MAVPLLSKKIVKKRVKRFKRPQSDCKFSIKKAIVFCSYYALMDAPEMVRSQMNFKRISLIDIKNDVKRILNKKDLVKAMESADIKKKWENSSRGKKLIVKKTRAALNDFDRFKIMLTKIKRATVVRQELAKLKKTVA